MSTTTYMLLTLPTPSVSIGPAWATTINAALAKVDAHTHTLNSGQQVPSAGININANLPFGGFGATNLALLSLSSAGSPADLRAVFSDGTDLFFRDGDGNNVQITLGGNVNSSAGSISGMSGTTAAVGYNDTTRTFTFTQASNQPALLSVGSITIRRPNAALANLAGITLISPLTTTSGAYSITLPSALPGSGNNIMMLNSSGVLNLIPSITTGLITDAAVTKAKLDNQAPAIVSITGTSWTGQVDSWQDPTGRVGFSGQLTRSAGTDTMPLTFPVGAYVNMLIPNSVVPIWNNTDSTWTVGNVGPTGVLTISAAQNGKTYYLNSSYLGV